MKMTHAYGAAGAALGFGAPLGLLALRSAAVRRMFSPSWVARELKRAPLVYAYTTVSTVIVFALFGTVLGRREDELSRLHLERARLRTRITQALAENLLRPIQVLVLQAEQLQRSAPQRAGGRVDVDALRRLEAAALRLSGILAEAVDAGTLSERGETDVADLREVIRGAVDRLDAGVRRLVELEVREDRNLPVSPAGPLSTTLSLLFRHAADVAGGPFRVTVSDDPPPARVSLELPRRLPPKGSPPSDLAASVEALGGRIEREPSRLVVVLPTVG